MMTTVTLNPMLDKTVTVDAVRRGAITRGTNVRTIVGGKGVNVARQLHRLGEQALAVTFAGGETGSMMERLLTEEGLPHRCVRVGGMTREGVTYREGDGAMTSVFEPPHAVTGAECRALLEACEELLAASAWVICSGSSPCNETDALFAEIIASARERKIPAALDSYGTAMVLGSAARPAMLKLNRDEFASTYGRRIASEREALEAAREIVGRGIGWCLISDGPRPLVAATPAESWVVDPPEVKSVNPTGSGDALLAGVLHGLAQGWVLGDALAFGVAAGAANAAVWDVCASETEQIREMLPRVRARKG
jgi:1-phosphofructokinase family hexose kinase